MLDKDKPLFKDQAAQDEFFNGVDVAIIVAGMLGENTLRHVIRMAEAARGYDIPAVILIADYPKPNDLINEYIAQHKNTVSTRFVNTWIVMPYDQLLAEGDYEASWEGVSHVIGQVFIDAVKCISDPILIRSIVCVLRRCICSPGGREICDL